MKILLVILLLAWLGGIIAGTSGAGIIVSVGGGLLAALWISKVRYGVQLQLAAFFVCCLGWLWGSLAMPTPISCVLEETFSATILRLHRIESDRTQYVLEGDNKCTLLMTTSRFPVYSTGSRLTIIGQSEEVNEIPEEYAGYRTYLIRQGIDATVQYPDIQLRKAAPTSPMNKMRDIFRRTILTLFPEPEASVALAMVLGQQGEVSERIEEQFRATGVTHIISISGLHISLLVGIVFGLTSLLPLPTWWRVGLTLICIWGYIALIGWLTPAVRAAFFWSLTIFAFQMRALVSLPTILLITITVLLSFTPLLLFDISFQLSFLAVAGIALALFLFKRSYQHSSSKTLVDLLLVSVGASVTSAPIVTYYFGAFSVSAFIVNLFIVPLSSLFLIGTIVTVLVGLFMPSIALLLILPVHIVWEIMDILTAAFSRIPFSYFEQISFPDWILIVYYVVIGLGTTWMMKKQQRSWREIWQ